ncbi:MULTISPECIES: ABC transporter substrate-binding protein [Thiomicrorhabdus]|uniref:ABC transporter substrate-binding protein n=1 Tax=Thiomicrorhabdus heinhorstiae TaxID=2748010 RepID=A0ABS0C0V5_9GAMM|nr:MULTISPECIES: ABC transporter substrate-binding protein [Thiomicrorhabdus]MBF6057871.1 ABC transporter substrate-binding protein [Thiomicrorhabdus heinhorstiae]
MKSDLFNWFRSHDLINNKTDETDHGRRDFLRTGCSCCATLALTPAAGVMLAAAGRAEAAATGTTLKVGHLPAGCVSHVLLAKKRGMFAKAGLKVDLVQFNGPADNIRALVAGELQMMHNPWTTTMAAYAEGSKDLRIIGGSGLAGIELVARKGSVANVNEFIGKAGKKLRVGTLRLDTLELVAHGVMSQNGVSYDDYDMTFFPSMVGMGEALINGSVDVCTLAQPYAEMVVKESGGIYLADSNDVWGPEAPDCVITSTEGFMKSEGAMATDYMAVLKASAESFYNDFDAALDDLQPLYGVPREILAIALKRQSPDPLLNAAGVSGIRKGVKYLIELGYFKTNIADEVLSLGHQPV